MTPPLPPMPMLMEVPWAPMPVAAPATPMVTQPPMVTAASMVTQPPVIAAAPVVTQPPVVTSVRVLPPTTYGTPKSALARIGDMVSEMERELSEELRINGEDVNGKHNHHDTMLEKELIEARRQKDVYRLQLKELEGQISDLSLGEENHNWQHGVHIARIAELEQLLGDAKAAEERVVQGGAMNATRVAELEKLLVDTTTASERRDLELRGRVTELEKELVDERHAHGIYRTRVEKELVDERHAHGIHRTRVSEAERLLQEAHVEVEGLRQQHTTHMSRIRELELVVADHASQRKTIADLERRLADAEAESGSYIRQQHHHRTQVMELEQRLADAQASEENHKRQSITYRDRVDRAERELEEVRYSEGSQTRERDKLRVRVRELEQELESVRQGEMTQTREMATNRQRVLELERENAEVQAQIQVFRRQEDTQRIRITELEQELAEGRNREVTLHGQALAHKREADQVQHLQLQLEAAMRTTESHQFEKEQVQRLQLELDAAKRSMETLEHDSEQALQTQTNLLASRELELQENLLQANERIRELEVQVAQAQSQQNLESARVREDRVSTVHVDSSREVSRSSSVRVPSPMSAVGQFAPRSVSSTRIELLPSLTDPFVLRVREASRSVAQTLQNASATHIRSVESQLKAASEAHQAGRAVREFELDSLHWQEIEAEQRTSTSSVEAAINDLKALREELEIQHQLTPIARSEIAERIDIDFAKCEDEMRLLQSRSTLGDLPDNVLHNLVSLHTQGVSAGSFHSADGLTPMHHATQHGRRDIVEYLLWLEGGGQQSTMLHARDRHGHTPLHYAQSSQQRGLEHYLREEVGVPLPTPPARRDSVLARRPSVSGIPQQYLRLLQQIEATGWNSVSWKNGYTMLHWAAGKGHGELFRYLVQLNADPTTRDYQSRSPLDLAKQSGNSPVVSIVQESQEMWRSSRLT